MRTIRDYSLTGPENLRARERGLAGATWYACPIPRKQMKELMQRRDGPAIRDTLIWLTALVATGILGCLTWGTWWAVPVFAVYGVLYGAASDSRWHEAGHGTAFKTRWMNDVVYQLGSFGVMRQPTLWRWSHARHHTDTIIVGRDREIALPKPPDLWGIFLSFFNLRQGPAELASVFRHAMGTISPEDRDYIPESEWPKVIFEARVWVAIYAATIIAALWMWSFLPLMLIGLPSFYGAWLHYFFGLTQHAGLAEDVLDHRLNSRTVYMNPIFRFIYSNMNYHVEHHMFPMVPYHALPKLHEAMKADCPPPYPSCWAAYKEIVPAILRQVREPTWFVQRQLPPGARPSPAFAVAAE
ncbi:MAG: fatty acid desaturase family protein [Geminicoccaceae bacterium]